MNTSQAFPFSRRSILRVAAILVIGYALTALAIQLWAQPPSPAADGWVPVSNPARAGSYGFAASDGATVSAARVTRSARRRPSSSRPAVDADESADTAEVRHARHAHVAHSVDEVRVDRDQTAELHALHSVSDLDDVTAELVAERMRPALGKQRMDEVRRDRRMLVDAQV